MLELMVSGGSDPPERLLLLLFIPKTFVLGLLFYVVRWPGGRHAGIDGSRGVPATRDDDDDDVNIPPPSGENGVRATPRAAHFSRYNFFGTTGGPF